jgi:hypothetical protein
LHRDAAAPVSIVIPRCDLVYFERRLQPGLTAGQIGSMFRPVRRVSPKFYATCLALVLTGATRSLAFEVHGAQLPADAQKVGENRYRVPEDFETTLKHYKVVYPPAQYPRKSIVNQPGIKAIHIANPSKKGFEGLNIYQANDEVRIYIVTSQSKPVKRQTGKVKK